MTVSPRQLELLRILSRKKEPVEWGDVWDSFAWGDISSPLAMTNFDRVADACQRKGWVALDADNLVSLTPEGRAVYQADLAARLRKLHCSGCTDMVSGQPKQTPCTCHCHQERATP